MKSSAMLAWLWLASVVVPQGNASSSAAATASSSAAATAVGDGYRPDRATLFAHFSNVAYCSPSSIADWSCGPCRTADPAFKAKVFLSNRSGLMQAFVGKAPNNDIVVAFRGTHDLLDWIYNLNFPEVAEYPKCDGCKVHRGFYEAWQSVQDGVVSEVRRLHTASPEARIFVTGHSLGGAVAAHCAAELGASSHSIGYPISGVYTFGQPRVGNAAFAAFYGQGTHVSWRLTHWRDPVPHLPPMAFGFRHLATEVYYTQDNANFTVCDGSGEDPRCSDSHHFDVNVEDHHHYVQPPLRNEIDAC